MFYAILLSSLVLNVSSNRYYQCYRGQCTKVDDQETSFDFDQPIADSIQSIGQHFPNISSSKIKRFAVPMKPETDTSVPKIVHMIWVGSNLPNQYYRGPVSVAKLNPGYEIYLWVSDRDHVKVEYLQDFDNIHLKIIGQERWENQDLMDRSTNYAMLADVLRLDILYRFGGIHADVDSYAKRSFGPVFKSEFLTYFPHDWNKSLQGGRSQIQNQMMGMPKDSAFMKFAMECLRENFDDHSPTILKTGPDFLTGVFIQYSFNNDIQLINWKYTIMESEESVIVDALLDADWSDKENILAGNKLCRSKENPGNCEGV